MSTGAPALARPPVLGRRRAEAALTGPRPLLRIGAFTGLALFGALRWGSLMSPAPTGRLLALVAVAVAIVAAGPALGRRSRAAASGLSVLGALSMLLICGLHWSWLRHLRIAVSARAIGNGLDALPRLLVPYHGVDPWVRMVLLLGAALLLFDAALMLAFAGHPLGRGPGRGEHAGPGAHAGAGDLRRAIAALPLIALAAVPLTLVPARFQYAEGAVMFALLAALVWGERLPRRGAGTAAFTCALAAAAAMIAAPWLDAHKPWIQYQSLATGLSLEHEEAFNWSQSYGPLNWPRDGRQVLEVAAPRADYWKAVDLESFDGRAWTQVGGGPSEPGLDGVSAATRARWTESIAVTVAAMTTQQIIGPGELEAPTHTGVNAYSNGGGRWTTYAPLNPGDSYDVRAYSPHPAASELAVAGTAYPQSIVPVDLQIDLPPSQLSQGAPVSVWPDQFGAARPLLVQSDLGAVNGADLLNASPYARAFALSQRLRAGAATPYAYVMSVMKLLAHGYTYDEHPPVSPYPLESFLFTAKRGYCQQFAGAMALLLRLGGVPARVAAGFTSGTYDPNLRRYVVSDFDAHAWVEAFFPGQGWVRFDPTPAGSDPAQQATHLSPIESNSAGSAPPPGKTSPRHGLSVPGGSAAHGAGAGHHGGGSAVPAILAGLGAALLAFALFFTRPLRDASPERLLSEIERAYRRTGRELAPSLTLAELERRLAGDPGAREYVQAISRARFAGTAHTPTPAQRRALRGALASGLGLSGRLRALWALPPRW